MPLRLLLLGFVAGFLATLLFHQSLWYAFNQIGLIPLSRPAWPTDAIPPFGVPSLLSKAFWGGLWGLALAPLLGRLNGSSYWLSWILAGAIALPLVAFFVVPPLKGLDRPPLWPRYLVSMMLNATWGLGTAVILRLLGAGRSTSNAPA
ncbi:MAG: hypothetical protein P8Y82_08565 [Methyloceanibacter sp.]